MSWGREYLKKKKKFSIKMIIQYFHLECKKSKPGKVPNIDDDAMMMMSWWWYRHDDDIWYDNDDVIDNDDDGGRLDYAPFYLLGFSISLQFSALLKSQEFTSPVCMIPICIYEDKPVDTLHILPHMYPVT